LKKTSVVDSEEEVENTSYDVANQILKRIRSGAFGSETTLFEQDANGNLTKETIQGTPDIVKNLAYNFENNMLSFQRVESPATENNAFKYSGDGLRVEKTDPAQELSKFTLDGVAVALHKASAAATDLKSFAFDGATTVEYGACPNFTSTGGLSVSAWVEDVNEAAGYLTGFLLMGGTNIGADSNFGGLFVDIAGVVSFFSSQSIASGKHHIYLRYDGSGSFADPHMELYLDGVKLTLTPNTGGTQPNFSGDLVAGMAQSNYDGKLDQLAIWDTDKGAGDFLAALYNEGEGRIIESDEEDLILLALFNENYDDSTGTFSSPTLTGNETYDDPLVTDARGPLEPKARFIPGLAMINAEGDVSYYLEDALGSVMGLADDEEEVVGVYQYDAWGNALVEPENDANPYRWCGVWGYYWESKADLYLLGLRWYSATTGQFVTRDPLGISAGINPYEFCANNPQNTIDPLGLIDCCALKAVIDKLIKSSRAAIKSMGEVNDIYDEAMKDQWASLFATVFQIGQAGASVYKAGQKAASSELRMLPAQKGYVPLQGVPASGGIVVPGSGGFAQAAAASERAAVGHMLLQGGKETARAGRDKLVYDVAGAAQWMLDPAAAAGDRLNDMGEISSLHSVGTVKYLQSSLRRLMGIYKANCGHLA
jgi:RHS repeat-associated protein